MDAEKIYEVLKAADAMGLITLNVGALARLMLRDQQFFEAYDRDRDGDDLVRAAALLVELDMGKTEAERLREQYPDYKVHLINQVECYTSSSGNVTWKAFDEDGGIIYLRQAHKELLTEAGLWDELNQMPIGAEWDADIWIHTIQDGDFRKPVMIGERPELFKPDEKSEPDPPEEPANEIEVIEWADRLVSEGNFVVLDTETTSLDGYPIQIGVLSADGEVLFDQLIKPPEGVEIDPKAQVVHGITLDDLTDAPEFVEIAHELRSICKDKVVVIYNADFDTAVINRACLKYDLPSLGLDSSCCMLQFEKYAGEIKRGEFRWQKLIAAAASLGITTVKKSETHNAIGDCRLTLAIVKALAAKARSDKPGTKEILF